MKKLLLNSVVISLVLTSFASNAGNLLNVTCDALSYDHDTMQKHTENFSIKDSNPNKLIITNGAGFSNEYDIVDKEKTDYGQVLHANSIKNHNVIKAFNRDYVKIELSKYSNNYYIGNYEQASLVKSKKKFNGTPHLLLAAKFFLTKCRDLG